MTKIEEIENLAKETEAHFGVDSLRRVFLFFLHNGFLRTRITAQYSLFIIDISNPRPKCYKIAMSTNSEIPCSTCHLWSAKKKSFSCNPDKCAKLSEWLFDHTSLGNEEKDNIEVIEEPIQYVV